jgi:hypothetical protein
MKINFVCENDGLVFIADEYFSIQHLKSIHEGSRVMHDETAERQLKKAKYFFEKHPEYLI